MWVYQDAIRNNPFFIQAKQTLKKKVKYISKKIYELSLILEALMVHWGILKSH